MISGRARKRIPKGLEEGKIYVGPREKPIKVLKRKEIAGYISEEFLSYFTVWTHFNCGMGLPFGGSYMDYPEKFIQILEMFIYEFQSATGSKG